MIRPTKRAIVASAAGLAAAALPTALSPDFWGVWVGYVSVLVALAGFDLLYGLSSKQLDATVEPPTVTYVGEPAETKVTVRTPGFAGHTRLTVRCDVDGDTEPVLDLDIDVADEAAAGELEVTPTRRGTVEFGDIWLRWTGPLGLFEHITRVSCDAEIPVVPNIQAVRRAALRLSTHHAYLAGLKTRRYIGDGSEFESLRQYAPGLDYRTIDWKASARHRELMCRENRSERNHRVIIAVDTGHIMSEPLDGIPRLDHGINAGLLLGYLSLRMGDQVGLFAFDEKVRTFSDPQPGVHTIHRLMHQSAGLDYSTAETNYTLALTELATRLRRRSIVVFMTDFTDTIMAELMVENLQFLARRHLVIFVAIRDPSLDAVAETKPQNSMDINRAVVAQELIEDREMVIKELRASGVFCVDAPPEGITVELINRYLDIHRRELIG
jgi:uncharacterized protein (DUF58 family)